MNTENKLPKAFKRKWLKALRSGDYKQGKNFLYTKEDDSYCCLGVACILVGRKRINGIAAIPENERRIPAILRKKYKDKYLHGELASMNDRGQTFKQIANYIEANL